MKNINSLPITVTHPDKIPFWDAARNGKIPKDISFSQTDEVYWICTANKKHRWKQRICDFLRRQTNCMFCNRKPVPERNRLSRRFPDIAYEFHEKLNKHLSPFSIDALSTRLVWWRCARKPEHEFCVSVKARTMGGVGCPFCSANSIDKKDSFAAKCKKLVKHWHFEENAGLSPYDVLSFSPIAVAWHCGDNAEKPEGHIFRKPIYQVAKNGLDCVICRRSMNSYPSLAKYAPHLAAQWHKTRNQSLTPDDVTAGSSLLVWWQCDVAEDHAWQVAVCVRTASDSGCPYCEHKKTSSTSSFALEHSDLLREWHPTRNKTIDPFQIPSTFNHYVWWNCLVNAEHEWKATVVRRTQTGSGCPICSNRLITKENALSTTHPEIAVQWHPKLNGLLTPKDVTASSTTRIFWRCKLFEIHVWASPVCNRTKFLSDCPKCISFRCPKEKSLKVLFPKVAREWHPTLNQPITPNMISPHSNKKFWWQCRINSGHIWETKPTDRVSKGNGCPVCSGRKITKDNSLAALYPQIAKQWHKEKNGSVKPSEVSPGTSKRFWWRCPKGPDHEWQTSPANRVYQKTGCRFCVGKGFSVTQTIAYTHPEIANQFHLTKNGNFSPEQIKASDTRSFWWTCPERPKEHAWESSVVQRVRSNYNCPICSSSRIQNENTLASVFPSVANEWHPSRNKKLSPSDVAPFSNKKVFWRCSNNSRHIWQATVNSRTTMKSGCPRCYSSSY